MIGLAKKREEAAKAKAAAAEKSEAESNAGTAGAEGEAVASSQTSSESSEKPSEGDSAPSGGRGRGRGRGVSIFGVKGAAGAKKKTGRRLRPGEIRVQKDVSELDGGDCAQAIFPNPNDLMNFEVVVSPDDGYWKGYQYRFTFTVPDMYPHEPPKVTCKDKIYHPNIDLEGNVCLNILRADWKPVLDINAVIYGLIVLFVQPNPDDPLNHTAAECLRTNKTKFAQNVARSLRGYAVDGEPFPPATKADK